MQPRRVVLALSLALVCSACGRSAAPESPAGASPLHVSRMAMGTLVQITAEAERPALEAAFAEIERLEALLSEWRAESEISRLNRAAGGAFLRVSPETEEVLRLSRDFAQETRGAFDPTVLPLVRLYGFLGGPERVPEPAEVEAALAKVGWRAIEVEKGRARLARAGAEIGLGAIAKGYIADRALAVLLGQGARRALVNAGGDIACFSRAGPGFSIEIEEPGKPGAPLAELRVRSGGIATSAATYRSFERGGERYHHVIDPHTGRPARGNRSATAVAPTAARADALATAFLVQGDAARRQVEALPDVEAILVGPGGERWASRGLEDAVVWRDGPSEPTLPEGKRDQEQEGRVEQD